MLGNEPTGSYDFLLPLQRSERGATTERVYGALREAIVQRLLKPGEFIDKNLVCDRLGVSRFPVSEALGRLGAQGFVEVLPQRGTPSRSQTRFLSMNSPGFSSRCTIASRNAP